LPSFWFVTPAHRRYELSEIVFHQRNLKLSQFRSMGLEAHAVVVADDKNLEIAERFGFHTIEQDNMYLGRRFNVGYEYAAENGADFFIPVGSDSWLDPTFLIDASKDKITASRHYQVVKRDGSRRLRVWIDIMHGVTYCVPRKFLKEVDFRPVGERLQRGCDTSLYYNLGKPEVQFSEVHPCETVAFQSYPQITNYTKLKDMYCVDETDDPFSELAEYYPKGLIKQVMDFYVDRAPEMQVRQIVREEFATLMAEYSQQLERG
jgi:hypothetical protein